MTVPNSVAISALTSNNNNNLVSTNQLVPTSCVSLVSSTGNGNTTFQSIPISIRSSLTGSSNQSTTMSWTAQGTPIQFAATAQRPNGTISFLPQQQTIYQMPNDTILPTQTMLITQPPSRPPDSLNQSQTTSATNQLTTGQNTAGSIVQIIQTPNGPAQLISSSTNLKQTYTMNNLITSSSGSTLMSTNNVTTNTLSSTSKSNKQILPKGSKSKQSTNTTNNRTSKNAKNKTLITTGTPTTINNLSNINLNNLNQHPQLMLNTTGQSTPFFTSNGLFFNQTLPTLSTTMGQQQFIINPTNLSATSTANQSNNSNNKQQNQTILIPSSANNQLKSQNIIFSKAPDLQSGPTLQSTTQLIQQNSTPQLIQLPNGQMLLVQPQQQTSNDTIQLQNFNQPQLQLIPQQTNNLASSDQTVSYSSSSSNFIITSQPSFVNSNLLTSNSTTTTTISNTTSKSKPSRRKPPAKKDNKNSTNNNNIKTETLSTSANKSKGSLNLADLLKEAGIMEDGSPPSSPLMSQTTTTTDLIDQNSTTNTTNTSSSIPQLSTLDLSTNQQPLPLQQTDQQSTTILNNSSNNTPLINQPTVVMVPSSNNGQPNYFFSNPLNNNQLTSVAGPVNTNNNTNNTSTTLNQPQFKLALAPDGSVILQTVPAFAQPTQLTQQTVQSSSLSSTKFVDTSKDSCSGSSQPSPDSTTPTLDTAVTPTSCSSLSINTPTITFTTNTSTNTSLTNNNSQIGSIKLSDSISLANNQENDKSQSTTPANKKGKGKKDTNKKSTNKKQPPNKTNNSTSIQPSPQQQLITIPIQTNLNSSMNSVITPNPNTAVIQIADNSLINNANQIKKNDSGILVLNQSNAVQQQTSTSTINQSPLMQQPTLTTTLDPQSGMPVVQININNQEFLDRLDTQVKSLSAIKTPTQEQENLLQELISLQKKMLQAKSNASESGTTDGNIILTSQPLIPQQQSTDLNNANKAQNQTIINPLNKLPNKDNKKNNNSTQIITITSKPLEQQGKKLTTLGTTNLIDQNKSQLQPTSHIIIQSTPSTPIKTDQNSNASNQLQIITPTDPTTTNTFEGQKIKLLTSNTNLTSSNHHHQPTAVPPQTGTFQLGNQFFTITTTGNKNPLTGNHLINADGSSATTQTLYQVVHLQAAATSTSTNATGLIKLDNSQLVNSNIVLNKDATDKNKTKASKFSFQQQLSADIAAASKPDTKMPFKNCSDACKRLLRYHVFHQSDLNDMKSNKFDDDFEVLSQYLLYKKEQLYRRFQYNVLKLAMKTHSSAENIMLDKSFVEQEKECLKDDKESIAKGNCLDLPEPSFEMREKINLMVEEEMEKLNNESKKRKLDSAVDDESEDLNNSKIKKPDQLSSELNESEDDDDSEASGNEEETNEMNEFNKYLDNLNDINPIEGLSPYYNNSDSYNSIMQMTDPQSNNPQSSDHHSNAFQLFNQDWSTTSNNTTDNNNSSTDDQTKQVGSSWVQEDAVAVESILDGDVNQQQYEDDEDDEIEDDPNNLLFDQKSNQINLNSDSDIQMESAINSILDILVPPTNSNVSNENGLSSSHNNMIGSEDQLSSNGFNFDNNLTSNNQVNFSQNNYLQSMPSIGMQNRSVNNYSGHNDYGNDSVLDEAVKSILS